VTTEYPPLIYGGLGTAVGGLVTASARAGIDVAVLLVGAGGSPAYVSAAIPRPGPLASFCGEDRVLVHPIPPLDAVAGAVRFVASWKPDVIHVHVFWLAHIATAIRQQTGVPLVYTVHSLDRAEYEIGQGPPECLVQWNIQSDLIRAADRVVALTEDESGLIEEYCAEARTRIRIVGNGIDDSSLARAASRPRHHGNRITVLYTGRFVDRKGVAELLAAAPRVLDESQETRLVLAGGHRHCTADEMARHWMPPSCEPFRDRIHFTGWLNQDEMNRWYASADVLVVPSWYEPFGMVILEGMLYGLAIVATDVGGPRAILSDGETGVFCQPRDVASLEEALLRVVSDQAFRNRLGQNAARHVRSRWLFDKVLLRMRNVYDELVREAVVPGMLAPGSTL
jgi:glycogen(starch) synthase